MVSAALGMVGRGGWETHLLGSGMYWGVAGWMWGSPRLDWESEDCTESQFWGSVLSFLTPASSSARDGCLALFSHLF